MKVKKELVPSEEILKSDCEIAKAIEIVANHIGFYQDGVEINDDGKYESVGIICDGVLDAYLYLTILAQQIYAGDVILVQKNDNLNKLDYALKLLQSVKKTDVDNVKDHCSKVLECYSDDINKRKDEKNDG